MSTFEFNILIAVLDAGARQISFDRLARHGAHVDGVADRDGAKQRLEKDRYSGIVAEKGILEPQDCPDVPVLWLEARSPDLMRSLQSWLQEHFPNPPTVETTDEPSS